PPSPSRRSPSPSLYLSPSERKRKLDQRARVKSFADSLRRPDASHAGSSPSILIDPSRNLHLSIQRQKEQQRQYQLEQEQELQARFDQIEERERQWRKGLKADADDQWHRFWNTWPGKNIYESNYNRFIPTIKVRASKAFRLHHKYQKVLPPTTEGGTKIWSPTEYKKWEKSTPDEYSKLQRPLDDVKKEYHSIQEQVGFIEASLNKAANDPLLHSPQWLLENQAASWRECKHGLLALTDLSRRKDGQSI
ncbi:hypothetical protein, partial [Sporisorium scitamineum]